MAAEEVHTSISSWGTHMDRDRRTRSVYMLKTNSGRSSDIKLL